MKKLMIAAAIVCAAVAGQAATASWGSDMVMAPADETGAKGEDWAAGSMYVFGITEEQYGKWAAMSYADASAEIWSTFGSGDKIDAATLALNAGVDAKSDPRVAELGFLGMGSLDEAVTDNAGPLYRAIILTDQSTGKDMYIANIDMVNIEGSATYTALNGAAGTTWAGTAGGSIDSWNAVAVPEPTSGLLLLLGVAGLALRRRRA